MIGLTREVLRMSDVSDKMLNGIKSVYVTQSSLC